MEFKSIWLSILSYNKDLLSSYYEFNIILQAKHSKTDKLWSLTLRLYSGRVIHELHQHFHSVPPLKDKDKRLLEATWWERLWWKLGLVLMGRAKLSKSLIQFFINKWGSVPSLIRKLIKLIKWTTALSNSMKLWAMPCRVTQYGWVMVESSDKTWSTGEGNGRPLQHSCLENPWTVWQGKKIGHWKMNSLVNRCPICYWRKVEK